MGMTSVRMPDELLHDLEETAEKLQRSKGWIINDAVKKYIRLERKKAALLKETLASWDDYENGRIVDGDKVMEWLETWGDENEKEPPF